MGAVEHLKTLCCLGLPPESAMVALTPLMHEIIPQGWTRFGLLAPDATVTSSYAENPAMGPVFRERLWRIMDDPTALVSLWKPASHAVGVGWTLHRQGGEYLESGYYREIQAPLDSCWILGAMIGDGNRSIAYVALSRPRSSRPFTADDTQKLDRVRPWLAHAFRQSPSGQAYQEEETPISATGSTLLNGQLIITPDGKLVYNTTGIEHLLRMFAGEPGNYTRYVPASDTVPAPVLKLLRQITGPANGTSNTPPGCGFNRLRRSHSGSKMARRGGCYPRGRRQGRKALPRRGDDRPARAPYCTCSSCAAGQRRHPGPDESRIQLVLGKTKPVIADELGLQFSSVADLTKKLYKNLGVHNPAELGAKIWLDQRQGEGRQNFRRV